MILLDYCSYALGALSANRRRTALIVTATAIGVASVVLLASLGEGARRFVTGQFESLGTNLLIVVPGRNETVGGPPPLMGETPRNLTIDDALAIGAHSTIRRVAPIMVGNAPVSTPAGLERDTTVLGSTASLLEVRRLSLAQGRFLPAINPQRGAPVCVLGHAMKQELFGANRAQGEWVRIGDRRFRVIGVLADSGVSISVDFNDLVIIPVASAQELFNQESLFRVLAEARDAERLSVATAAIHSIIAARHEGEDDVTVITQDSVVETVGRILDALTFGIVGISAISLAVAGILIMNVMLVSVTQRRAEIGLLKALGAKTSDIRSIFLLEAMLLATLGAAAGLGVAVLGARLIAELYPTFPVSTPLWAMLAACSTALVAGFVFGSMPAKRAARLNPIEALAKR